MLQKMPKKNSPFNFPGNTPLKLKQMSKHKQLPSRTCCKHSRSLSYYYWPVIAVRQQCADTMATVHTQISPISKEQADLSLHCLSTWSVRQLRVFTVDVLTWIVHMCFIRNNNSLFQQINTEGTLTYSLNGCMTCDLTSFSTVFRSY